MKPRGSGNLMRLQWIVDHWFEITTTILLAVIAINTFDGNWNNAIVEQLNDLIGCFSSRAKGDGVILSHSSSGGHSEKQ
jgi:hypothetical protein